MTSALDQGLAAVVGARSVTPLAALGLSTVEDLLRHYPRRYGKPGELSDMTALRLGEHVTIMAQVRSTTVRQMKSRGGAMLEAVVTDGQHTVHLTFFAKRPGVLRGHEDKLRPGRTGLFTGTVGEYRGHRQLVHPDYLIVGIDAADEEQATLEASKPIPLYPASAAAPTWRIARAVRTALDPLREDDVPDPVPAAIRQRLGFGSLLESLRDIHVPTTMDDADRARARLTFEEALVLQAALARRTAERLTHAASARQARAGGLLEAFDAALPFDLTPGQREVGEQIAADLERAEPMLRLLQGDVGSGKTIVALRAMLQVIDAGGQAALLAPTEVLASQHERTLRALLGSLAHGGMLGGADAATRIVSLAASHGSTRKRQALAEIASGAAGIVVGTHALLGEAVTFADLGLVVVDEQHRFGVEQRDALRAKGERVPHTLVMTATPIPRTVAMTVFGDLEVSALTDKPAGRAEVTTHVVPAQNQAWMERIWLRVREEVDAGHRVYVVCPRIEADSAEEGQEDPTESTRQLEAVSDVAARLAGVEALRGVGIGVMHGRLAADAKERAMDDFYRGVTPVLVATTVVEVGVDVPDATLMVILDADHFGISQLHQLRGRVGRAQLPGLCLLVSHAQDGSAAQERLAAVAATTDGFALAEKDLELRREGDVLGSAQSGGRNALRLLRVVADADVIASARLEAKALVEEDPTLATWPALCRAIDRWLGEREEFLERA